MPASKVRRQTIGKGFDTVRSEVLYFLAPGPADLVNSIVGIMEEEGPRPMRNMRPAQKQRTGAEKFHSDHHGQYEARGRQSRDKVNRVHTHNNAYPKMYDELDSRRSTAKPSMRNDRSMSNHEKSRPLCCRCLRLKNRELKQIRRYSRSPNRRIRSHKMKTRITKPKQRFTKKYQARSKNPRPKFNINKGCQYYRVPLETKSVSTYDDDCGDDNVMPGSSKRQESGHKLQDIDENKSKGQDSSISIPDAAKSEHSRNPGTSAPSLSSYNSYLSMDHEPMVE